MLDPLPTRRIFLRYFALPWLLQIRAKAQTVSSAPTTRPDVARIDHERILRGAAAALDRPLAPERSVESEAFLQFTLDVPALAAACMVDRDKAAQYRLKARALLSAWLGSPSNRFPPNPHLPNLELLAPRSAMAEVAMAIPFLELSAEESASFSGWFRESLAWLNSDPTAQLARDARDHNASAWLLQAGAFATLLGDDAVLDAQRHRFEHTILRTQINAEGLFRNDLSGPDPFRDSLYNLDLLAGSALLLSTRFESVWDFELQDGPGMRAAVARYAAYIAAPSTWPYPADAAGFADLPGRRPALLFAGRAYSDADYVALWRKLNPDPKDAAILRTFPVRQPLLWVTRRPYS